METKFTKGKWIIDGIDVIAENGQTICQVYDADCTHISEMNMKVVEANAKLIAAAPELLEFAIEMVKRYPNSPWISKQGQAAINKATK
jgi:hypothetical protein